MENAVKLFPKWKRKCMTMKLTTSKKSKRYCKSQFIRNQQPLEQHLSTDSSDIENPETSETISEASEAKTLLLTSTLLTVITFHCRKNQKKNVLSALSRQGTA